MYLSETGGAKPVVVLLERRFYMDTGLYVTSAGLQKIKAELAELKTERMGEVAEKLQIALAYGEVDNNPDYDSALQEQAIVEERIQMLEDAVRFAIVIEEGVSADSVRVGSTVKISEEGWDEVEEYRIVSVHEAAPSKGLISSKSPLGSALLGAKVGDLVVALTPGGEARMHVLNIA
jgi:transcription elongation factor GreA